MSSINDVLVGIKVDAFVDGAIAKLHVLGGELDSMDVKAKKAGTSVSNMAKISSIGSNILLGIGAAAAVGLGLAVKASIEAEDSYSRLSVAMTNAKINTEENRKVVMNNVDSLAKLGFKSNDVTAAYGTLVTATGSITQSTKLMGIASDYARYKNIDLGTAATILARGTQGSVKAFKELGITLDSHISKNAAIGKAFDELSHKIGGQATEYTKTFKGEVAATTAQLQLTGEKIGSAVLPVLSKLISGFNDVFNVTKKYIPTILLLAGALATMVIAWKAGNAIMTVSKFLMATWAELTGTATVATGGATAAQWSLNTALDANPIGVVIIGLTAFIAVIVLAWNKLSWFRDGVVKVFQVIIDYVGYFIGWIGTLVSVLASIPGIGGPFKGIADDINNAANSVRHFSDSLDNLKNKKFSVPGLSGDRFGLSANTAGSSGGSSGIVGDVTGGNSVHKKVASTALSNLQAAFTRAATIDAGGLFSTLLGVNSNGTLMVSTKAGIATAVSVWGKSFGSGIQGMIASMRDQIKNVSHLQSDSAKLLAEGFSKQFVSSMISQGPLIANKEMDTILNGSLKDRKTLLGLDKQSQKQLSQGIPGIGSGTQATIANTNAILKNTSMISKNTQINPIVSAAAGNNPMYGPKGNSGKVSQEDKNLAKLNIPITMNFTPDQSLSPQKVQQSVVHAFKYGIPLSALSMESLFPKVSNH